MNEWIKIRSWHIIKTATRVPGRYVTLCGKSAYGQAQPDFLEGDKTCESCLRINAAT
jgi:hypothetical protein